MTHAVNLKLVPRTPEPVSLTRESVGARQELWKLLDLLALCRQQYGLTASSLAVLRALISFLPKSAPASGDILVWPSNRSLSERADGMDERTLRRHLERLVKAGMILRCSSSNGKRFALRCRSTVIAAFGFDLAPLRGQAEMIASTARSLQEQTERSAAIRVEILNLLHSLSQHGHPLQPDDEAEIRRMLRRRNDPDLLAEARDTLLAMLSGVSSGAETLTASNRQNDRHQQNTEKDSYESVTRQENKISAPHRMIRRPNQALRLPEPELTLDDCLRATTESRSFAQDPVRSWSDLIKLADFLAPMIGIERELAEHIQRAMGRLQGAISILCIIQRSRHIRHPAAYLRRLATLAENGMYSLNSLVRSAQRERFAGANHGDA